MVSENRESFGTLVAEQLVEQLRAGTAPWQRPWTEQPSQAPYNAMTGKPYHGINTIILEMQSRQDPRWLTYRQAREMGAQVRKNEHGVTCQKWIFDEELVSRDERGAPIEGADGRSEKARAKLERPKMMLFTVFNAEQIDGLPALQSDGPQYRWDPAEQAERLLVASGADIRHSRSGGAHYSPGEDYIQLPDKDRFPSPASYYATAAHELGHWTGHNSRLQRDLSGPFGSEAYAKEELRAEIASMMLGRTLGVGHDPGSHAAYVDHWINILQRDHLEIFRAAADAEKIHGYMLELVPDLQQIREKEIAMPDTDPANQIPTAMRSSGAEARFYLQVDRSEKDQAKGLGARWDPRNSAWYVPAGVDPGPFSQWWPQETGAGLPSSTQPSPGREYLAVPYSERAAAKAAGAQWDAAQKSWFAGPGANHDALARWRLSGMHQMRIPKLTPRDEFAAVLEQHGLILKEGHPIMDGRWHRLKIAGDREGEHGGAYRGYLDGHPAGYVKNHRTQVATPWKSLGYTMTDEERARIQAESAAKLAERAAELEAAHECAADRLARQLATYQPVREPTPYMVKKGIDPTPGVYTNTSGDTIVPAHDIDGKHWTTHYISSEGRKRLAADSRKEGTFHVLGTQQDLEKSPVLVLAEGYSTASEVRRALGGRPVIAAFDSGNLPTVAKALRSRYPDKAILICGDDDSCLIPITGHNAGQEKAREAAAAVKGAAIFPTFLPADTKADPRAWTDFNDLARSALGREGVERQVKPVFARLSAAAQHGQAHDLAAQTVQTARRSRSADLVKEEPERLTGRGHAAERKPHLERSEHRRGRSM